MAETCANPLLAGWLKEWMDTARERNSKGHLVYKKAYQSMLACDETFNHPCEAEKLVGLGPKLCSRLTDELKKHCDQHEIPMPLKAAGKRRRSRTETADTNAETPDEQPQPTKKPRQAKLYVPKLRSGAWALVMALSQLNEVRNETITKQDLITRAQPLCDSSFTAPSDPTKFQTAWSSMKTLEEKELICSKGHPAKRYYLSDEGWDVARRMIAVQHSKTAESVSQLEKGQKVLGGGRKLLDERSKLDILQEVVDLDSNSELEAKGNRTDPADNIPRSSLPKIRDSGVFPPNAPNPQDMTTSLITLEPGTFEVKLLLDTREVRTKTDRDYISKELKARGITPETRALPLCDVLWIAKLKPPHDSVFRLRNLEDDDEFSNEVVLEHGIERKRLDDLVSSIRDGRFHEQKFRLAKSGLRHITYLVEDYSLSEEKIERYQESWESAMVSMQVVNDIFLKETKKIDETISYIAGMTRQLKRLYESKELFVLPTQHIDAATYLASVESLRTSAPEKAYCTTFSAFCALCDKSDDLTLGDVYLKMLMCIRGVTAEKAVAIRDIWPTPIELLEAYHKLGDDMKAKNEMISVRLGGIHIVPRRKIAKDLSTKIAEVWSNG